MSAEPEHDSQLLSVEPSSSEESFYDSEPTEYCQNLVEIERLTGLFDPGPATSVLDYAREVQFAVRPRLKSDCQRVLQSRLPQYWKETELPFTARTKYDKAFACEWLSDRLVVIGTKCNHLLCLDVISGLTIEIPLPVARTQPATRSNPNPGLAAPSYGNCGIHAIAFSPDGRFMATGGFDPAHCQIYEVELSGPNNAHVSFRPAQTLVGHLDWIFGIAWVTDRHLVTGSRDQTAKLWQVDPDASMPSFTPMKSQIEKDTKVRDVKYHQQACRVLTLTTNGCVQIWDPHLNLIQKVQLHHDKEVVCMALCDQLAAVGTQTFVSLIDPRCHLPAFDILSRDPSHGVRSVSFQDHILTSGSGRGRLAFYDLRAGKYLDLGPSPHELNAGAEVCSNREHLQLGRGWLVEDSIYWEHFNNMQIHNACYAHAWDPSSTKIMSVGGPLPYGLRGCYMGLWD